MNKIFGAAVVAVVLGAGAVAHAGQGIPNLPAQPIIAQSHAGVIGQSEPVFTGARLPVVSLRVASRAVGQDYPQFAPVRANPVNGPRVDYADNIGAVQPRG